MRSCEPGGSFPAPGVLAVSFLAGAVPFSFFAARALRHVDLRDRGNGTVSATGVWQVAGFGPPTLAALACGAAVAGHNWSPFLRGAGGRGLSVAIGGLAATQPTGAVVLVAGLGLGKLAGQTGFGCLTADVVLVPLLRRTGGRQGAAAAWAVLIPMLAKRLAGNGPARSADTYLARLLFDRDELSGRPRPGPTHGGTHPGHTHPGRLLHGRRWHREQAGP